MLSKRQIIWGIVLAILLPPVLGVLLWIWVLTGSNPLIHNIADKAPWPVACSLRGCITTLSWDAHNESRLIFASAVEQDAPSVEDTLTTLIRQHLVANALLRTPVTKRDAKRYREEVLNAGDNSVVLGATKLTLDEYDELVILPLLQQEALRQERGVEGFDELFEILAKDRPIVVLPWSLRWDKGAAKVIRR